MVGWLQQSFSEGDFVVLKMDIEGAERQIVPKLLATNASRLVDVMLWECHLKWRGMQVNARCTLRAFDRAHILSKAVPYSSHGALRTGQVPVRFMGGAAANGWRRTQGVPRAVPFCGA